jgi:hypothetical protein
MRFIRSLSDQLQGTQNWISDPLCVRFELSFRCERRYERGFIMATILPFVKDGVFDHEDITAMSTALDDVCKILNLPDDNSAREVIACRIIDLAKAGERNPTRLRDRVLHEADLARKVGLDDVREA